MPDHLYNPKAALFCAYPAMKTLSKQANDLMEGAEKTLSERELAGCDTSWARDRLAEAEWRIGCTSDHATASSRRRAAENPRSNAPIRRTG